MTFIDDLPVFPVWTRSFLTHVYRKCQLQIKKAAWGQRGVALPRSTKVTVSNRTRTNPQMTQNAWFWIIWSITCPSFTAGWVYTFSFLFCCPWWHLKLNPSISPGCSCGLWIFDVQVGGWGGSTGLSMIPCNVHVQCPWPRSGSEYIQTEPEAITAEKTVNWLSAILAKPASFMQIWGPVIFPDTCEQYTFIIIQLRLTELDIRCALHLKLNYWVKLYHLLYLHHGTERSSSMCCCVNREGDKELSLWVYFLFVAAAQVQFW